MRVLLKSSDMQTLAALRDKLQKLDPTRAITDSDVVRKAIGIAYGIVSVEETQRGRPPRPGSV